MNSLFHQIRNRKNTYLYVEIKFNNYVIQIFSAETHIKSIKQAYKYFAKIFENTYEWRNLLNYDMTMYINMNTKNIRVVFNIDSLNFYIKDLHLSEFNFIHFLSLFVNLRHISVNKPAFKCQLNPIVQNPLDIKYYNRSYDSPEYELNLYTSQRVQIGILTQEESRRSFDVEKLVPMNSNYNIFEI